MAFCIGQKAMTEFACGKGINIRGEPQAGALPYLHIGETMSSFGGG
jgi:hypothetical protein